MLDTLAPTVVCKDSTIYVNSGSVVELNPEDVIAHQFDNCAIASTELSVQTLTCENLGTNEIIITVSDSSENISECTAMITLVDTTSPEVVCPANVEYTITDESCEVELDVLHRQLRTVAVCQV